MQMTKSSPLDRRTLPATTKLQAPTQAFLQAELSRKADVANNQRLAGASMGANPTLPSLSTIDPEDRELYLNAARSIAANKDKAAQAKFSDADSPHIKTIDDYISALQEAMQNGYARFA